MPAAARRFRRTAVLPGLLLSFLVAGCGGDATGPDDAVAALAVLAAPSTAVTGAPLATAPVVELRSSAGAPVALAGVSVTASVTSGSLIGTTSVETDDEGHAVFSDLVLDGDEGLVELRFTCCDLPAASHPVSLALGEVAVELLAEPTLPAQAGMLMHPGPSVRVRDRRGRPQPGAVVKFALAGAGRLPDTTSIVADAAGVAELPWYQFGDLPGTAVLTATDSASGASASYELESFVVGEADLLDEGFEGVVAEGETITLPAVQLDFTNSWWIMGPVRYRVVEGDGVLAVREAPIDNGTGLSEPVTLTAGSRGTTLVEIIAVGHSAEPRYVSVTAVVSPVTLGYPEPCEYICHPFEFAWPASAGWYEDPVFTVEVRDAVGTLEGYPVRLTEVGEAGMLYLPATGPRSRIELVSGHALATGPDGRVTFSWGLPVDAGSYSFSLSGPRLESPWTFTATRP